MRIEFDWPDADPRVGDLLAHFAGKGKPLWPSELFRELADDAIDVWCDDHLVAPGALGLGDPCDDPE